MSYILDALNKSERERKSAQAPGIDTLHHRSGPPASAPRLVMAGLIVLAVINGGALAWWFGTRSQRGITASKPAGQHGIVAGTTRAAPGSASSATHAAATQQAGGQLVTPSDAIGREIANNSLPPATKEAPIDIADLPVDIKEQIPAMTFSSHIYSDDAKYRMVNINGELLHEGDTVSKGMRLVRITEEGVVLSFQGYTFKVSVLHDWSFN